MVTDIQNTGPVARDATIWVPVRSHPLVTASQPGELYPCTARTTPAAGTE